MFIGGARGLPSKGPAPRPRPALPPALPAPRGTPTYRPGQSVNNAAVQRYEPAPVRAAQHQAAQRGAYVAAPHHYGPVTPPVNVRRSTVNTTRSPAHATTQRLAKAIGGSRGNTAGAPFTLARVVANMSRYAGRHPFEPIATNAAVETGPLRRMQVQGQLNQDFTNLLKAGLLPKGAKQPPISFPQGELPGAGAYESAGRIYFPPEATTLATDPKAGLLNRWGQEALLHEFAHTLQSKKTMGSGKANVEGGAQAYAAGVAPRVLGPVPIAPVPSYEGYVNKARKRGSRWVMQGQFQ